MASSSRAFYRSIAMHNAILAIVSSCASPLLAQLEIGKLGQYKSRGHGGGHNPKSHFKMSRNRCNNGGSGRPHQGKQEIARRLRSSTPSVPVREWKLIVPNVIHDESWAFVDPTRSGAIRLAKRFGYTGSPVLTAEVFHG